MKHDEPKSYLAFDLGASTSRAFLGTLRGTSIEMEELHRFTTPVLEADGHLYWDLDVMWAELQAGLNKAKVAAPNLKSLSVDSWGVDYVLLDDSGEPLRNALCYRDPRTEGLMDRAFDVVPASNIYSETGIQFLPFNTLYQVLADLREEDFGDAKLLLPIADYFNYRFSGRKVVEVSLASTTQLMDVHSKQWSRSLMDEFHLDRSIWPEIVQSGTRLGPALSDPAINVVATCSHDTGSAVAAAPAVGASENWAYISCGTWSLIGVERREPLVSAEAREAGFTNEAGLDGTIRFLKNLTGLWVLQECMREWREAAQVDWPDLEREARTAKYAFGSEQRAACIDLDAPRFLPRGPMEDRVHSYCREHGLGRLETRGEIVLAILSSLAESYRRTLNELERVSGTTCERIHLFGGGSQNQLLCELTAEACGREVVAGPVEATAMGNLLIQARALGGLPAGTSIRDISAASSELRVYSPRSG